MSNIVALNANRRAVGLTDSLDQSTLVNLIDHDAVKQHQKRLLGEFYADNYWIPLIEKKESGKTTWLFATDSKNQCYLPAFTDKQAAIKVADDTLAGTLLISADNLWQAMLSGVMNCERIVINPYDGATALIVDRNMIRHLIAPQ